MTDSRHPAAASGREHPGPRLTVPVHGLTPPSTSHVGGSGGQCKRAHFSTCEYTQLNVKSTCNSHLSVVISSGTCFLPDRQPRRPREEPEGSRSGQGAGKACPVCGAWNHRLLLPHPVSGRRLPSLHWAGSLADDRNFWPVYLLNRLRQVKTILKISLKEF